MPNTSRPAAVVVSRICADALVDAERRIEARIAERVPTGLRRDLEYLLEETVDAGVTRFVWLRQFEPGNNNSADANRLLDRLEHLRRLAIPEGLFHDVPAHRITRLRERYFADGLRELPDSRRLAILAVCAVEWELFLADAVVETHDRIVGRTYREAVEWELFLADAVVETHDRIVGRTYREAARTCEGQLGDETAAVREALRAFAATARSTPATARCSAVGSCAAAVAAPPRRGVDVDYSLDGEALLIPKSKSDQLGRGAVVYLGQRTRDQQLAAEERRVAADHDVGRRPTPARRCRLSPPLAHCGTLRLSVRLKPAKRMEERR